MALRSRGFMCMKATLRWLFGTNAEMSTRAAQEDAEVVVNQVTESKKAPERDPYLRAITKIEQLSASQTRLDEVLPARSLGDAMDQMFERRR